MESVLKPELKDHSTKKIIQKTPCSERKPSLILHFSPILFNGNGVDPNFPSLSLENGAAVCPPQFGPTVFAPQGPDEPTHPPATSTPKLNGDVNDRASHESSEEDAPGDDHHFPLPMHNNDEAPGNEAPSDDAPSDEAPSEEVPGEMDGALSSVAGKDFAHETDIADAPDGAQ